MPDNKVNSVFLCVWWKQHRDYFFFVLYRQVEGSTRLVQWEKLQREPAVQPLLGLEGRQQLSVAARNTSWWPGELMLRPLQSGPAPTQCQTSVSRHYAASARALCLLHKFILKHMKVNDGFFFYTKNFCTVLCCCVHNMTRISFMYPFAEWLDFFCI